MKRQRKSYKITKIYPLFFWYMCLKCKSEFRREHIYKIIYPLCAYNYQQERYFCAGCYNALGSDDAVFKYITRRPKPPMNE